VILRSGLVPCLNASDIPAPAPDDPQFLVREDGSTSTARSATITWRNAVSGTTTTARLHKTWFITETNGSVAQTLPITYTDWDGDERIAYLFGNPGGGYRFLSVGVGDADGVDFDTCLDTGSCADSETLEYVSPDGRRLSAEVAWQRPLVGSPAYEHADEDEPMTFAANGVTPADAEGAINYQWRFQTPGALAAIGGGIPYNDPVVGEKVDHTWGLGGKFAVELTATDSVGHSAVTTFWVEVGNVSPTLGLEPVCSTGSPADPCSPAPTAEPQVRLSGTFDDPGEFSTLSVWVNWGDGNKALGSCFNFGFRFCTLLPPFELDLNRSADGEFFEFDAAHTYAADGTYDGTVWVTDNAGATDAETFVMTVDTTAPHTTITLDLAAPNGVNGSYRSPVTVNVAADEEATVRCVVDPSAVPTGFDDLPDAACDPDSVAADGPHVVYAASRDAAGNTSGLVQAGFSVDLAPQTAITLDPAGPDGTNGWYRSPVAVAVSADDPQATVRCVVDPVAVPAGFDDLPDAACDPEAVAADGNHVVYAASRDVAGNNSDLAEAGFKVDATVPHTAISFDPSAPDGANGWYRSPATFAVRADEPDATVRCVVDPPTVPAGFEDLPAAPCLDVTIGGEGSHVVFAASRDAAGNDSELVNAELKVDVVAPHAAISLNPGAPDGADGWYRSPVGIAVSADDPNATVRCVVDPPAVPGGFGDLPNASCDPGAVTGYGIHVVYAAVADQAGNRSAVVNAGFKVDTVAPHTEIALDLAAPDGTNGWYRSPVGVAVTNDDPDATLRCVLDPAAVPAGFDDLPDEPCDLGTVDTDGAHVVYAASRDPAGNVSDLVQTSFKIDRTAPHTAIMLDLVAPDGTNGWYRSPVEIAVNADDADATVRCVVDPATVPASYDDLPAGPCAPGLVGGDGPHVVYAASRDTAGNDSEMAQASFKIDRTAPHTEISLATPDGANGWHRSPVAVTVAADDSGAIVRCVIDPAAVPAVFDDLPAGPCDPGTVGADGPHVVYAASRDIAGNDGEMSTASFKIDRTVPHPSITLDPAAPDGPNDWYRSAVAVAVTADDPNATVRCGLDSASVPADFDDLPRTACNPFTVSTPGTHVMYAAVADRAGNRSPVVLRVFTSIGGLRCHGQLPTHIGTVRADVITGSAGHDVIITLGGADTIRGRGGNDTICTGTGNDTVYGGAGNDQIDGSDGHDRLHGQSGNNRVTGGEGNDQLTSGSGNDRLDGGRGDDRLLAGAGDDRLLAGPGDDLAVGGRGRDVLDGGAGHDRLFAGAGDDRLFGGPGDDVLDGGPGVDIIRGGAGSNRVLLSFLAPR
jgi:RTX calcium-binding nonapeptide repeat (4 copies)